MGLDLWFREDVARILAALASAGDHYGPNYQKALADVALAFGVTPPANGGDRVKILDVTPRRYLADSWK